MATRITLIAAAAAAMLTGCGENRSATALAAPFTGTWMQVAGASSAATPESTSSIGFVSLGTDRVTANMSGGERGVFAITENLSDPGLRAGRLRLEDGSELFLCAGQGFVDLPLDDGRLLAPTSWLDVRWIRRDGRETNLRLWSSDALAAADLAKRAPARHAPVTAPIAASVAASVPLAGIAQGESPADPRDRRFSDSARNSGDRFIALAARELVAARTGGSDERGLAGIFARMSVASRSELLTLLTTARDGHSEALAEADRLQAGLQRFDQAFSEWLPAQR